MNVIVFWTGYHTKPFFFLYRKDFHPARNTNTPFSVAGITSAYFGNLCEQKRPGGIYPSETFTCGPKWKHLVFISFKMLSAPNPTLTSPSPAATETRRRLHVLFYGTFNASLSKPRRALISINISGSGMDLECVCKWVSGMKVLPQPQSIRAENEDV